METHIAPVLFLFLIFLIVLPGIHSIKTFDHLSVQSGGSATIPCHYEEKYKNHIKYWCKGLLFAICSTVVRSDSSESEGDVSIADDPDQLVFSVTMRNLQRWDTNRYWCAVEIGGITVKDDHASIFLTVHTGEKFTTTQQTGLTFSSTLVMQSSTTIKGNSNTLR
uniref:Ig-like domain-containing protein n=1 Tax=Scleropages formosus TaxID=113540 RepID=A0A8D0CIY1_SCLFO